jgi:hypothetical protein
VDHVRLEVIMKSETKSLNLSSEVDVMMCPLSRRQEPPEEAAEED